MLNRLGMRGVLLMRYATASDPGNTYFHPGSAHKWCALAGEDLSRTAVASTARAAWRGLPSHTTNMGVRIVPVNEMLRSTGLWLLVSGALGFAGIVGVSVGSHGNAPLWLYLVPAMAIPVLCLWWRHQWANDHPPEATDEDELD